MIIFPWQGKAWKALQQFTRIGHIPHALLLTGPQDCGLVSLASAFHALLICERPTDGVACASCRSCKLNKSGAHPDAMVLTLEYNEKTGKLDKEIKIDAVRSLIHRLTLTHTMSPRKNVLIHPAELMNVNAATALLKTLEEPPGDAVIILASTDPGRLLPTIRSRCQVIGLEQPGQEEVLSWLKEQHPEVSRDRRLSACYAARNRPLLADRYLGDGGTLLEARKKVAVCLLEFAAGRGEALKSAQRFTDLPQNDLWQWLADWMAEFAASLLGARADAGPLIDRILEARPGYPARRALELQAQALRAARLQETPLRKDLLLADWLIQWQRQ